MIVALIGKDQFSKDIRIEKFIADALGERKDDPLSKQILYATDTNIPSIAEAVISACDSVSMFSPEQAVVVRKAEALKADDTKSLAKWLSHGPQCKLLLDFETLAANTELFKALKKAGEIEKEYDEPKSYKMADWIASVIPSHFKKAIDKDACQYLAEALGTPSKERLALMDKNRKTVFKSDDATSRLVYLYVENGKYDQALDILKDRHFRVWEGGQTVYTQFVDAHLLRGLGLLSKKRNAKALEDFLAR